MTHETDPNTPEDDAPAARGTSRRARRTTGPQSADEWRELLRQQELPPEISELSRRKRRKARRHWRSAQREERTQLIRRARKNTPTPIVVPILGLIVAAAVAAGALLWPDKPGPDTVTTKPTPTVEAPRAPSSPAPAPSASAPTIDDTPQSVAKAFTTAYTNRRPLEDGGHEAAVDRARPYMSTALAYNLAKHDDRDFDRLVAAQATAATPTKVTIGKPTSAQRPAPTPRSASTCRPT